MESSPQKIGVTTIRGTLSKICYPLKVRSGFILNVIIYNPGERADGTLKEQFWKVSIFGKTLEDFKLYNQLRGKELIVECFVNGWRLKSGDLYSDYANNLNLKSLKEVSYVQTNNDQ